MTVHSRASEVSGDDEDAVQLQTVLGSELGLDSLDLTEIFMRIGEDLGIELSDDCDFDRLVTFGDLLLLAVNLPTYDGAGGEVNDAPSGLRTPKGAI